MRSTQDNSMDDLGAIGAPIRPKAPAKPDIVKDFASKPHELISNHNRALETVAETLRKKAQTTPGTVEDWQGCDFAPAVVFDFTDQEAEELRRLWRELYSLACNPYALGVI